MTDAPRPKVGVAVIVLKTGKVLLGRRCGNAGGDGLYAGPGGHVEFQESLIDAAKREVMEETGMEIENLEMIAVVNVREFAPQHHVMIVFRADWKSGEPKNLEPDRCEGWDWYPLDQAEYMTPATGQGIAALKTGKRFFE